VTTLTAAGQATPPLTILRGESADYTISTSAGFDGVAWLQERLDDYTWRNRHEVEPGESETVNGPATVRVWIEKMELGDDLTAVIEANDDVLWQVTRADGKPVIQVRARSGLVGAGAGGSGAVSTVNGKIPTAGDVTLSATDVGADATGAANDAKLAAIAEAQARLDLYRAEANPNGITKATLGLNLVENIEPAEMPVSNPQQTAINNAVANRLTDAPNDGNEYVRKNGVWQLASAGGGTQTQIVTESQWASITPGTTGVIYHVYPDPPPTNLVSSSFATGWTDNATWDPSGDNAVLVGTANGDIVFPLTGLLAGHNYEITFGVINHIKANITPGFTTDGTTKLHTTTRQGSASPGTTATYTVQFAPSGGAPSAFLIRSNAQDGLRDATITNPIVYDLGAV
jgi:hypothetical protein